MKDGKWLVPERERPRGWEMLTPIPAAELKFKEQLSPPLLKEKPAAKSPLLDSAIVATEKKVAKHKKQPDKPKQKRRCPCGLTWEHSGRHGAYSDLADTIHENAKWFGVKPELVNAALVLVSGMWTQKPSQIEVLTGLPRDFIAGVAIRCLNQKLWHPDKTVTLGEMTEENGGDLEFWLNAMAAAGEIDKTEDGAFRAIQSLSK